MGPSNTLSRNLVTGGGEPIQHGSSEQHKAAEIDLIRKNASEIYDIVFSADRAENSERENSERKK